MLLIPGVPSTSLYPGANVTFQAGDGWPWAFASLVPRALHGGLQGHTGTCLPSHLWLVFLQTLDPLGRGAGGRAEQPSPAHRPPGTYALALRDACARAGAHSTYVAAALDCTLSGGMLIYF